MRRPARRPTSSVASVGRSLVAVGAVVIIGGGAAIGYAVTRKATGGMTPVQSAAMASAIGQLDGDIKARRAAVQARATTLSGAKAVQGAVLTDKRTAADMLQGG